MKSHKIQSYVLLLLHIFSFLLPSSTYILPDTYFINCGSDNNINSTRRTFTGDLNSRNSGFVTFSKRSSPIEDNKKSTAPSLLYQTARLFRQKSFYEFKITNPGTYILRLHFYAFPYPADLSTALFDVSASGLSLLHNFTVDNSSNNTPVIKEFLLNISTGKLVIDFIPGESSLAFVNAIEAFLVPDSFISDDAPHVSSMGSKGHYNGILSKALRTIHRINVGGPTLTPDNDTLWRHWVPDNSYLFSPNTALTSRFPEAKLDYPEGVSEYTAPDLVYQTAKKMNIDPNRPSNFFNITWSFDVAENTRHFVRVHFCDIVSSSAGDIVFSLYVYSNFSRRIDPYERTGQLTAPFYDDFVVDSDDSGMMNITIGPSTDSNDQNAFLNGLEIMEIIGESVLVNESRKITVFVLVGSILGGSALISILAVFLCLILRRRKPKTVETLELSPVTGDTGGNSHRRVPERVSISSFVPDRNLGLKIPFAEIMFATNNFDVKMRIGKGGFGSVFRGTLSGRKVAVKRSEPGSGQGLSEFQTEIRVLSIIRHRHLVSLIGYCDERSEMILVYEFMENGTLRDHLYGSGLPSLPWMQRLEICIGAARGLHYLHTGATGGFIHRDIKSTNILLDENCVAKVADFGLSKLCHLDQAHVSTSIKGTFGYLDPEYLRTQQLTEKSDVYSFGVVLLEVLCARPVIDNFLPTEKLNLADWAMLCKDKGTLKEIIDPTIRSQVNPNSLRKFAEIAEKCLQQYGSDRPTMSDVLWDLEYALQLQQTATQREPHEDSRTNDSAAFLPSNVGSFPSLWDPLEKDEVPILREHSSSLFAGQVFSQLGMDDAR